MNYRVIWIPRAVLLLNTLWLAAPAAERTATTAAALTIDHNLATDPHAIGRHIFDTLYEYDYPPLGVEFEVIDADRQVLVLTCWSTATGRPTVTGN